MSPSKRNSISSDRVFFLWLWIVFFGLWVTVVRVRAFLKVLNGNVGCMKNVLLGFAAVVVFSAFACAGPIIVFNDNGGWCWYQDERVIIQEGKLIIGSVANALGTDGATRGGNVEVVTYDIEGAGVAERFVLHATLENDDHDVPAFLALPDGRVLAVYSKHSADRIVRYRTTTSPYNTTAWEPEVGITCAARVCYSNLFRLSTENNGHGRIYDFYRGESWNPNFISSDDDGQSWYYGGHLIREDGHRPYVKYTSDNVSTIHFITTEGHPQEYERCSIYHGKMENGAVYHSDGTFIKNLSDGPVAAGDLTKVFDGDLNNNAWTADIHLDANGYPYIGYSVQINRNVNDYRYCYARWDGTQWYDHEIAYAGSNLCYEHYTGLMALDPHNPNRVYISADVNPYAGEPLVSSVDGRRHHEIFAGITGDYGATWTWRAITRNSAEDNLRPIVPVGYEQGTVLLWMQGTYSTYRNYDTKVVGMFDPAPEPLRVPLEYGTIQAAIDAAMDGDTVIVADGTYAGEGNRDIDFSGKGVTVRSENGPGNCIIDCNGTEGEPHRGFYFDGSQGRHCVLDGFTITNGYGSDGAGWDTADVVGGAIYCKSSKLMMSQYCPVISRIITIGYEMQDFGFEIHFS